MKRTLIGLATALAAATLALASTARADEQDIVMGHMGRLTDGVDAPVNNDALTIRFRIFKLSAAVASEVFVWEGSCQVKVVKGLYSAALGGDCGTGLKPSHVPTTEVRYLEVTIDATPMVPRLFIGSAPTAATATNALSLGGLAPAAFWQKTDAVDAATLEGEALADLDTRFAKFAAATTGPAQTGSLHLVGEVKAAAFEGDGSKLTNVAVLSGANIFNGGLTATSFAGSGAGLTGLDASMLAGGTISDLRLPTNLARTDAANVFTLGNRFSGNTAFGTVTAAGEAVDVGGNVRATNALLFVPQINDYVGAIPYRKSFYAQSVRVVSVATTQAKDFLAPSVIAQNDWDWDGTEAFSAPAPPAGTTKVWARVTIAASSNHYNNPCLFLRRETFNLTNSQWAAQDEDISLGCPVLGQRAKGGSIEMWVPWWKTNLVHVTRAGPTQRLLLSMEASPAATPAGAVTLMVQAVEVELFASRSAGTQTFSTSTAVAGAPLGQAQLEVPGALIRTIARWQGNQSAQADAGVLEGRRFTMIKVAADTGLRVAWNDNFRVVGNDKACRWEITFNGASCPGGALVFDQYEGNTSSNRHDLGSVFGTCFGLAAGPVDVATRTVTHPGHPGGDCSTGWNNQLASIEGEEVR